LSVIKDTHACDGKIARVPTPRARTWVDSRYGFTDG